jgi:hypothetical protein
VKTSIVLFPGSGARTIAKACQIRPCRNDQLFVSFGCHAFGAFGAAAEPPDRAGVIPARQGFGDEAMDWRNAMVRTETPYSTAEDEAAYAAGWTISGLATLGTIIAVWMFAI